jgi:hypothetical protein
LDVWPLLLLSTSDTPESAGLGGREPATGHTDLRLDEKHKKSRRQKEKKEGKAEGEMKVMKAEAGLVTGRNKKHRTNKKQNTRDTTVQCAYAEYLSGL